MAIGKGLPCYTNLGPHVEPCSTEKLSIHRGDGGAIAKDHVAKKLDVGGVPTEQKSAESMEIESLLIEQALLEELLAQEELEIELAKVNNHFEREKSRVNSTISASSDVAPSGLTFKLITHLVFHPKNH